MKALVLEGVGKLNLRDVPKPACDEDGIVIKTMANGICRSDWHKWRGDQKSVYPRILGHEFCGMVEQVGEKVKNFKPGDRVIVPVSGSDGTCEWCKSGHANLCESYLVPGIAYNGGFAEYVAVPLADRNALILPDNISFVEGSVLGCRFVTAYHGLMDAGRVKLGDQVAVFGCGGVGLSCVAVARQMGAFVIAVDINDDALKLAMEMGADYTINSSRSNPVDEIMKLTHEAGVEVAVDALGAEKTCVPAIYSLAKCGRMVQLGVTSSSPAGDVPVPLTRIVQRELTIKGSLSMPIHEFKRMLEVVATGKMNLGKMLTGEVCLSDVVSVFEKMTTNSLKGTYVVTDFTK